MKTNNNPSIPQQLQKEVVALRSDIRRFKELINNLQTGVFFANIRGEVLEINHALVKILKLVGMNPDAPINVFTTQQFIELGCDDKIKHCIDSQTTTTGEGELKFSPTQKVFLSNYFVPIMEDGQTIGVLGSIEDITEKRAAKADLDRFFDLPQNLHLISEMDGTITRVNRGFYKILGYSFQNIVGSTFFDLVHPDDQKATLDEMSKLQKGQTTFSFINRYLHEKGHWVWLDWSARYIPETNQVFAVARDITEEKKAEESIKTLNNQQAKLLEVYDDLLQIEELSDLFEGLANIIQDEIPGSVVLINSVNDQMKTTTLEAMAGLEPTWILRVSNIMGYNPKGQQFELLQSYRDYLIKGKIKEFGNDLTAFSAGQVPSQITSILSKILGIKNIFSLGLNYGDTLIGAIHIFLRKNKSLPHPQFIEILVNQVGLVFKQKKIENDLINANSAKDKLFSILGHDLRGPLSQIIGFSELIEKDFHLYTPDQIIKYNRIINGSSDKLMKLLEDILLWSTSHNLGKIETKPEKIQILVDEAISLSNILATKKNVTIFNGVNKKTVLQIQSNMFRTIIRNLVNNAIKFTHPGGKISIGSISSKAEEIFNITDNGVGMPPYQLKTLFRPGSQSSSSGTEGEKGSGLGLEICRHYVQAHGGNIWAESELNKGTTIFFSIKK